MLALLIWSGGLLVFYPSYGWYFYASPQETFTIVILALLFGVLLPRQVAAVAKARSAAGTTSGVLGTVFGVLSMSCCAPLILPALLSFVASARQWSWVEQPRAILGEGGPLEARLDQTHAQKPTKQEVIGQFLTERSLTADRVQADQQRGFQQPLRWNRPAADLGVHRVEHGRQFGQRSIRHGRDCPQRMVRWNDRLHIDKRQHADLRVLLSAQSIHLSRSWLNRTRRIHSTGGAGAPRSGCFSPPC
jgi:hypothetical protein